MIQPSGDLGVGHFMGAIKHWVDLQSNGVNCLFAIADLHAITVPQKPDQLSTRILDLVAFYIACGIDPTKSTIFTQSHVPHHAELAWILSTITSMGELNRMTQFKDKTTNLKRERIGVGLHIYPILMAADILIYQTQIVPVGADQKQHLELTRDLAQRFNDKFGDVFKVPEPSIATYGARIKSLTDPSKKMSKSDTDPNSYIALTDTPKVVEKKIKRAVTDSLNLIQYDVDNQPGLASLLEMYAVLTNQTPVLVANTFHGQGYGALKQALADELNQQIATINEKYKAIRVNEPYLHEVLSKGAEAAKAQASQTLQAVYDAMGLI
jgi:tryptophanyl-tRNA synthetase